MMARPRLSPLHPPPAWADGFVGLPWDEDGRTREGLDCYGLHRVIQAERFGRTLPLYEGVVWKRCETRTDQVKFNLGLEAFMDGERLKGWETVWEARSSAPEAPLGGGLSRPGDLIWIRNNGARMHIGTVVCPGYMLHIEEGIDSVCVPYDGSDVACRVMGFYRWAETGR